MSALLQVRGLTRRFGGNVAVDGVDFDVESGELLAFIGPNGAGKSTTFNLINGQLAASAGSVRFDGREILGMASHKVARLGVARSFQVAATFGSLTVLQNVQMALIAHRRRVFSLLRRADDHDPERAMALLQQVGMAAVARRPCSELAYGDVKRLELAMTLASEPRLLLMDEPTAGMAPAERNALVSLVKDIVRARNMGVLFTEHSMDVVFDHADRIIVLARGRLIAQGDPASIRAHPEVRRVYFGSGVEDTDTGFHGYRSAPMARAPDGSGVPAPGVRSDGADDRSEQGHDTQGVRHGGA
jgi:ABC-type branched-subunit amino acid transport system ATPase component